MQFNRRTPLHYAARYGHTDIFKLLEANGGDVNKKDKVSYWKCSVIIHHYHSLLVELRIVCCASSFHDISILTV